MKISESQVNEFITLYSQEYNLGLERKEAIMQLCALITLVSKMLPDSEWLEKYGELLYNSDATSEVI